MLLTQCFWQLLSLLATQQLTWLISAIFHSQTFSCHSPLLDGHLFGGHAVRQKFSRLCGGQQISRMDAVPAEVLAVVRGLGLDQRQGEGLGFGRCLWRHLGFGLRLGGCLRVRLRERLNESLRFWLCLWGLRERFGVRWWGLGERLGLDVGRFGEGWRRLLCESFGKSLRRLDVGLLLAAWNVRHCPGWHFSYQWLQWRRMIRQVWKKVCNHIVTPARLTF